MPAFHCHVFVCCNRRAPGHSRGCCDPQGSAALRDALKAEVKRQVGPDHLTRVNQAGCLDQCEYGPALVIYPQGIWYGRVQLSDVPRIVRETVLEGRVLDDLRIPDECLNTKGRVPWKPLSGDSPASNPEEPSR